MLRVQHRLEVPRQQRLDRLHGAAHGQMLEQIVQVRVRLHLTRAADHHQRVQSGARLGAGRIAGEQPCSSADRVAFYLPLDVINLMRKFWITKSKINRSELREINGQELMSMAAKRVTINLRLQCLFLSLCDQRLCMFVRVRVGHRLLCALSALALCIWQLPVRAFEPVPSGIIFYNRAGIVIPAESLRFANAGWSRGRDQGFAVALQKNTSYFYLWILSKDGAPLGQHLYCDGNLLDDSGEPIPVDEITSFTLGDMSGKGSNFLIAVSDMGRKLLAWNLTSCQGQGTIKASAQLQMPAGSDANYTIRGDVISGDFDGTGKDLVQNITPDTGELFQWALNPAGFRLVRRSFLQIAPNSKLRIHGIKYVGMTRLPHDSDNTAYEAATIILHDEGYTLARNDKAIAFSPNCHFQPVMCANKTLLFDLDQGFTDGLQDLARKDRVRAGAVLERMITSLRSAQKRFVVWALINPINEDREATLFILDKLTRAGIPFVLDYYSSDVTALAFIKMDWLDYKPIAYAPLKGLSLNIDGPATSADSVDFYSKRYGDKFVGLRFMERLAIDMNTKNPVGQPMIPDAALATRELSFDWGLASHTLEWADRSAKIVIWADPAIYIPYECYRSPAELQVDASVLE